MELGSIITEWDKEFGKTKYFTEETVFSDVNLSKGILQKVAIKKYLRCLCEMIPLSFKFQPKFQLYLSTILEKFSDNNLDDYLNETYNLLKKDMINLEKIINHTFSTVVELERQAKLLNYKRLISEEVSYILIESLEVNNLIELESLFTVNEMKSFTLNPLNKMRQILIFSFRFSSHFKAVLNIKKMEYSYFLEIEQERKNQKVIDNGKKQYRLSFWLAIVSILIGITGILLILITWD